MKTEPKRYGHDTWWLLCHLRRSLKAEPERRDFPPVHAYNRRRTNSVRRLIEEGFLTLVREDTDGSERARIYYTTTPIKIQQALNNGRLR